MKQIFQRLSRGSILAYTLIILGIVLAASISMFSASISNFRSASSNNKSMNAFQIADSGSQAMLAKIKQGSGGDPISSLGTCSESGGEAVVTQSGFLGGAYKVTFLDENNPTHPKLACTDTISKITAIKSVGTYADTARSVQVAVAAGLCSDPNNAGKTVVVAKNDSNETFSSGDFDDVNAFVNSNHGVITGGLCKGPGGFVGIAESDVLLNSPTGQIYIGGTDMHCIRTSICTFNPTSTQCTGGWVVYGICPVE